MSHPDRQTISAELIQPPLSIEVLTESEFAQIDPSLAKYRALVYTLYTSDGHTTEVVSAKPPNHSEARYLLARSSNLTYTHPNNPILQHLQTKFLPYKNIAGLFRLEFGQTSNGDFPIEAMELLHYSDWPQNTKIGYFSQFSPNPLLPKTHRLHVLNQLFAKASNLVHQEGFAANAYVILAQHVLKFVQDAGITVIHLPGATLNWSSPAAKEIFETWPVYWQQGDPQLYKFIPFPPH